MKVLVVGATGFIGSVVTEHLLTHGHDVVGLLPPGQSREELPAGADGRSGDLTEPKTLTAALTADIGGVINLATPSGELAVDAAAAKALMDPLRGTGKPYIYTSGIWVLGATGPEPVNEDAPTKPIAIVGYRPSIEQQVLDAKLDGVRSIVIRPAIAHGRGGGIPALLVAQADKHGTGRYVGDPTTSWPMVHVDDLAELFVAALEKAEAGTLFHAVAEEAVSVTDLALAAAQAAGVTEQAHAWPLEEARAELGVPFADALALSQVCSGQRARDELDWQPSHVDAVTDLKDGSYTLAAVQA